MKDSIGPTSKWLEVFARDARPATPPAVLVARCPCEEHDYCDESCKCAGVVALKAIAP